MAHRPRMIRLNWVIWSQVAHRSVRIKQATESTYKQPVIHPHKLLKGCKELSNLAPLPKAAFLQPATFLPLPFYNVRIRRRARAEVGGLTRIYPISTRTKRRPPFVFEQDLEQSTRCRGHASSSPLARHVERFSDFPRVLGATLHCLHVPYLLGP